jgi:hypothetical protein
VVPDFASSGVDKDATGVVSLDPEAGTVVIAGHGAGARAEALALELGAPLIAEVVSGVRFGPHLVPAYRQVLRDEALAGGIQLTRPVRVPSGASLTALQWRVQARFGTAGGSATVDVGRPSVLNLTRLGLAS